jgi:AcrR family transcriptional regulator
MNAEMRLMSCCAENRILVVKAIGGHRERKKQRTREQIVESAFALFRERGFQATTVADIAAAADIAPRTFFAYFPSKEAVVFYDFDGLFESLQAAIVDRPEGVSAIDALRSWLEVSLPAVHHEGDDAELRKRLCFDEPSLAAHQKHLLSKLEMLLRDGVARDLGEPSDSLRPKLVAAAAVAAMAAIDDEQADKAHSMALLDEALVFLRGGVAALQAER